MRDNGEVCGKESLRENEVYFNRMETQMLAIDKLLDRLVIKVTPVSIERPSTAMLAKGMNSAQVKEQAPLLKTLYCQLDKLEIITAKLEYIMESIEI